eukprot:COSAG03_NODE_6639_length_1026_cov_2.560949_1_plen_67_part_10
MNTFIARDQGGKRKGDSTTLVPLKGVGSTPEKVVAAQCSGGRSSGSASVGAGERLRLGCTDVQQCSI